MKTVGIAILILTSLPVMAEEAGGDAVVVTRRPDAAELARRQAHQKAEMPKGVVESTAPAAPVNMEDKAAAFMARSIFLVDGRNCTLLPLGAVIHIPKNRADSAVKTTPKPQLAWNKFYSSNLSWLREFELSVDEVMGKKEVDIERVKAATKSGAIVVCTYLKQPVSPAPAVKAVFSEALESK